MTRSFRAPAAIPVALAVAACACGSANVYEIRASELDNLLSELDSTF